jgi:hypothetical protein
VLWGYRSKENKVIPDVWQKPTSTNYDELRLDPTLKIKSVKPSDENVRKPVAGSLGMHLEGAACPHPDLSDTTTTLEGALYRVCLEIPGYDKHKPKFRKFVLEWCKRNLTPLKACMDTSVERWLSGTPYTQKRKEELLRKFKAIKDPFDKRLAFIKSFIKDEFYPDYKHARAINSRTDEFKTLVGPIFQLIGEEMFSRPEFIKKVPVDKRPEVILRDLYQEGCYTYFTDFSSFEAHFKKLLQEDCEFIMYDYMTQHLPEHDHFMKLIDACKSTNRIEFKNILLEIEAKRMSGEMNTSLGNGFTNLMLILYVCSLKEEEMKEKNPDVIINQPRTKVEGDDSLFTTSLEITTEDFTKMGLRIKLGRTHDLCRASFCGMVFDPIDMTNVSDPREVLATFGWTTSKYIRSKKSVHMTLLRCKALSLAYQYPSCPILSSLARNVLRLTRSHEIVRFLSKHDDFINLYEKEILLQAIMKNKSGQLLFQEPGQNTRKLVEELYGISFAQQKAIEEYFDSMVEVCPLRGKLFLDLMPEVWLQYYNSYSAHIAPNQAVFERPGPLWPTVRTPFKFT